MVRGLKEGGAKKGDAALDAAIALLVDIKSRLPKAAGGDGKGKGKGKGGQKGGKSGKGGDKKKGGKSGKGGDKKTGGGGGGAAGGAGGGADQELVTKLDLRVGVITKAWAHPDSDKLFCEEIDVGEDAPRQIASGLRKYYSQPEMEGHRVIVVCNLKKAKLGGFDSYGMVLCATDEAGDVTEFVTPPEGAPVGERVLFDGMPGEPASSAQIKKKKVFEGVMPDLKTNGAREACYKGVVMATTAGPCVVKSVVGGFIK